MINLLPPELKTDYQYARRNSRIMRFIAALGLGIAGLAGIVVVGLIYIEQSSGTYIAQADELREELAAQKQAETQMQVKDITSSIQLAVQVLSQEVLFSQLLKQLATVIPSNAILTGVNISSGLTGGVNITARAANYDSATQLQVNLSDPENKIFTKADILSINCSTSSDDPRYPCLVNLRAQFAQENPFLFINNKAGTR